MSSYVLIIAVILFAGIFNICDSLSIWCDYRVSDWDAIGTIYSCEGSLATVESIDNVTTVSGAHRSGKSNLDVRGLSLPLANLEHFPRNLEELFPNIIALYFVQNNISSISHDDLAPFPDLQYLDMSENRLTSLDSNLFSGLNSMIFIRLFGNSITNVGRDFILPNTGFVSFGLNTCINEVAETPDEINALRISLRKNCPPKPLEDSVVTASEIVDTVAVEITDNVTALATDIPEMVNEVVEDKSNDDEIDQLQILHSTREARFFLEGCTGVYESANKGNGTEDMSNRTIIIENEDNLIVLGLFSLHQVSILLHFELEDYVNITLGIDKNRKASISGHGNFTKFGNYSEIDIDVDDAQDMDKIVLPGMPWYIALDTKNTKGKVFVTELRLGKYGSQKLPFLQFQYTNTSTNTSDALKPKFLRIDHDGPIYAHYGCCELNCIRQTFHRISGCNKYSTQSASSEEKFELSYYYKNVPKDKETLIVFQGNFFIFRPGNTPFAAKIRLYDDNKRGDYYDTVLTDTYATIYQYVSETNITHNETLAFPRERHNPVTINVTVTNSGRVSLARTYETKPFMVYNSQKMDRDPVVVKFMSMSKVYGDTIRYDFYYNCSEVLTYFNETTEVPASKIIPKKVKRFNETRYDLVQIFNDSFNMNEKYGKHYNGELRQLDDTDFNQEKIVPTTPTNKNETLIKIFTGACSFLFVGFLKWITSLECIKNMTKDQDGDTLKDYKKSVSKTFDAGVNSYFEDHCVDDCY